MQTFRIIKKKKITRSEPRFFKHQIAEEVRTWCPELYKYKDIFFRVNSKELIKFK